MVSMFGTYSLCVCVCVYIYTYYIMYKCIENKYQDSKK